MFYYDIEDTLRKYARKTIEDGINHTLDLDFDYEMFDKGWGEDSRVELHYRVLNKKTYDRITFVVCFSLIGDHLNVTVEYARLLHVPSGRWLIRYVEDDELKETE